MLRYYSLQEKETDEESKRTNSKSLIVATIITLVVLLSTTALFIASIATDHVVGYYKFHLDEYAFGILFLSAPTSQRLALFIIFGGLFQAVAYAAVFIRWRTIVEAYVKWFVCSMALGLMFADSMVMTFRYNSFHSNNISIKLAIAYSWMRLLVFAVYCVTYRIRFRLVIKETLRIALQIQQ